MIMTYIAWLIMFASCRWNPVSANRRKEEED